MENDASFLGRGWAFPPGFSRRTNTVLMVEQEKDIEQSLQILLNTGPGERVMQAKYGSNLKDFVFEIYDQTTITFIRDIIETAIIYHEPRILLEDIRFPDLPDTDGVLKIELVYKIRETNTRSNLVFPFYINEATDLREKL